MYEKNIQQAKHVAATFRLRKNLDKNQKSAKEDKIYYSNHGLKLIIFLEV